MSGFIWSFSRRWEREMELERREKLRMSSNRPSYGTPVFLLLPFFLVSVFGLASLLNSPSLETSLPAPSSPSPTLSKLLPPLALPPELEPWLVDFDSPLYQSRTRRRAPSPSKRVSSEELARRAEFNNRFERAGDALLNDEAFWWDLEAG